MIVIITFPNVAPFVEFARRLKLEPVSLFPLGMAW
jgi:hypothetical protein